MSTSPDESHFTACVVGESLPEEQAAFALSLQQDSTLRREAEALHRTARHLAAALKSEPAVMLTSAQRKTVLDLRSAVSLTKNQARPAWWVPTLATAGIAAAAAVGVLLLPAPPKGTVNPASGAGIPSVSIQPASTAIPGQKPVLPPPSVASGSELPATIPEAMGPVRPAVIPPSGAMAAVPPVLDVPAVPAPVEEAPLQPPVPPVRRSPGNLAPGEALGSPPPR
jgi:hypothetical protein